MATNGSVPTGSWTNRKRIAVVGTAAINEPAIETEEVQNMGAEIGETTTTYITICASSRHVLHTAEEVGGVCSVCQQLLCVECAKHTCAFCGECVCKKESRKTRKGDVCQTHGFLEVTGFLLLGSR